MFKITENGHTYLGNSCHKTKLLTLANYTYLIKNKRRDIFK